jgi:hypothetical protein
MSVPATPALRNATAGNWPNRLDGLPRLLGAARETEIGGEIALVARCPGEAPPHPLAISGQLVDRCSGDGDQRHISTPQVRDRLSNESAIDELTGQPAA